MGYTNTTFLSNIRHSWQIYRKVCGAVWSVSKQISIVACGGAASVILLNSNIGPHACIFFSHSLTFLNFEWFILIRFDCKVSK